jgi:hypothetical protein
MEKYISKRDTEVYEKYFDSSKLGQDYHLFQYQLTWSNLEIGFLREITANLHACQIGKKEGLDYSKYKNRLTICMSYLQDVYRYMQENRPESKVNFGRLVYILEREVSRL